METYEAQINDLRKQVQAAEEASKSAKASAEATQKDLERALPFEKEVKEKNLLIGKLRHEAVTLNEHLTKALRILKKGRPEDNVDRQIITNYFLHFLAIDRSDPKKFEALQLISMLLGWTDGTSQEQQIYTASILTTCRAKRASRSRSARHFLQTRCTYVIFPPHAQHTLTQFHVRSYVDGQ